MRLPSQPRRCPGIGLVLVVDVGLTPLRLLGFFITFVMSPLAADLAMMVEAKEREQPGVFGPYGAYAQVFALFNCSMAVGVLVFPLWVGLVQAKFGWGTLAWSLALICGVAAIPVVSQYIHLRYPLVFTLEWPFR